MAIYTGGIRQHQEARASAARIAKQQAQAQAAESKRKGRSGLFGKIGGALLGAAAVGLTGLTGGLAAPLVMGAATSLGKKWADEASQKGVFKTPGQVGKITADNKYGYGKEEAAEATQALKESRKSTWSAESMLGDIASSYVTAGLSGGLSGGAKQLMSGEKGSIAKAFGGAKGSKMGWEGIKQAFGYELEGLGEGGKGEFSVPEIDISNPTVVGDFSDVPMDWDDEVLDIGQSYEVSDTPIPFVQDQGEYQWFNQEGGRVPQMNPQQLMQLLALMSQQQEQTTYSGTPLEEKQKPSSIADHFASQGKTLGGNNTQSLSQMLGR